MGAAFYPMFASAGAVGFRWGVEMLLLALGGGALYLLYRFRKSFRS